MFAGAITNPLALIVNEDSKFMQDARQAVEFNPDFDIANMGYEASKFFGAFLGLGKLMGIGKAAIQFNKLGTVGKEAVRGLGSVFAGYEGSDENLVDAFMSMGANPEEYPVLRRLMTDPDDSDLEGRLKNVLADLPIEAIAPSIILTTKIFKKYRKAKKDNAPNFQATEKEFENALDDLKKQSNELLDQYSVGAAINPEGDLAKSIIEEADVNTSVSKLAPKLSVKDSVVNYVQSPSLMSRDELIKSLDSDPTVVKKSVAALRNLGKVNDDGTVTIYRRIPLRKGEELKDEAVISGSHDVRAVRDAHEGLEGITTFDIFGQPKARGEEVFVKYKVPIDRIKGYLPEVGEYTRGTQARIQRAMQGRIDEKRKQGLGQFTKLKETKKIFERLVNKEKEIIADVSGIKPEKLDRAILYDPSFDDIIEGKVKTGDEYKKANPGITFDETAKIRQALAGGNTVRAGTNEPIEIDQSLAINPKTGKRFTYDEFIDYDKQKAQEYVDKIRDDFGLPKLAPNKSEKRNGDV